MKGWYYIMKLKQWWPASTQGYVGTHRTLLSYVCLLTAWYIRVFRKFQSLPNAL